ncbi:MAG: DUF5915 domain-containing protein, partial [Planctomycetota bacterium]
TDGDQYVQYNVVPNFKRLGKKVGRQIPELKKTLASADGNELLQKMQADGFVEVTLSAGPVKLENDDIEVRLKARDGWAAAQGVGCVVVLNTEVTDELRREGIAKDLIRTIQNARKDIGCDYTDRIFVGIVSEDAQVQLAVKEHGKLIGSETLADTLSDQQVSGVDPIATDLGNVFVRKAAE